MCPPEKFRADLFICRPMRNDLIGAGTFLLHDLRISRLNTAYIFTTQKCIGVFIMTESDKERAVIFGEYMVSRKATVRGTAKAFGVSKSTVHKDLTEKLPKLSPSLYKKVKAVLEENKQQRHIRGGLATKHKYEEQRLCKSECNYK